MKTEKKTRAASHALRMEAKRVKINRRLRAKKPVRGHTRAKRRIGLTEQFNAATIR